MVTSKTAEMRFRHVWGMFEKELTMNYRCSLSEIAAKARTDLNGMRTWMLDRDHSVSQLKKRGSSSPLWRLHTWRQGGRANVHADSGSGTPKAGPSLLGIHITVNSGTSITAKETFTILAKFFRINQISARN